MKSTPPSAEHNKRILIIDDNRSIHEDFRKILCPALSVQASAELDIAEAAFFGDSPAAPASATDTTLRFQVDSAYQGEEGVALARAAQQAGRPYAMAFVDMRMPPGWDGLRTTQELWKICPSMQIVICTAYSDHSWEDLIQHLGHSDRMVILKKPFDAIEAVQLANAFTEKWRLLIESRQRMESLEQAVQARTAQLEISNDQLRTEIIERRRIELDLEKARDLAVRADCAKSAFLANMSHEIRTPMNGVIGMINLLLDTSLSPEQTELAQNINQSGETLLHIINDILDFSKIEAGMLTIEQIDFDLPGLIEKTVELCTGQATAKGVELICKIDPALPRMVVGDPVRLRQILLNLINNALKFTARGKVVISARQEDSDVSRAHLRFEVTDTGIGIAPDVLPHLFQAFIQADSSTTRLFGGTGLGLAICKRITELLHGQIGASSTPGQGSTFWVTLALTRSDLAAPDPDHAPPIATAALPDAAAGLPLAILIVEDNPVNQKVSLLQLRRLGYNADIVSNGLEALGQLSVKTYDIVFMDSHMPLLDGFDTTREIRRLQTSGALPGPIRIISMTANAMPGDREACLAAGMDDYLSKPVRPADLRLVLERNLRALHSTRPSQS